MALCTSITDAGTDTPRAVRWGWWHVECMAKVIRTEGNMPADTAILDVLSSCPWQVKGEHTFTDPVDGEVFTLHPGDTLDAWRDR